MKRKQKVKIDLYWEDLGIAICAIVLLVIFFMWFPWRHSIRAYNKNGKYLFTTWMDKNHSVSGINHCRAILHQLGGGICKIPKGSLVLGGESLKRAPYFDVEIDWYEDK